MYDARIGEWKKMKAREIIKAKSTVIDPPRALGGRAPGKGASIEATVARHTKPGYFATSPVAVEGRIQAEVRKRQASIKAEARKRLADKGRKLGHDLAEAREKRVADYEEARHEEAVEAAVWAAEQAAGLAGGGSLALGASASAGSKRKHDGEEVALVSAAAARGPKRAREDTVAQAVVTNAIATEAGKAAVVQWAGSVPPGGAAAKIAERSASTELEGLLQSDEE
jgi:hypothetical protein